jgi:secondary thiamine-phosphate synthase enzyme
MKIIQQEFTVNTRSRCQMMDITSQVRSIVGESGIKDGDAIVFCPHTTAGVTINENADRSVQHDILLAMEKVVPEHQSGFQHIEGNSDAHVKSSLIGCSEQVLVTGGSLHLGTWQGIFFCEFDGPRNRRVYVQIRGQ